MLLTYFGHLPAARARLADAYTASLAKVADGAAKQQGVRYGERAADRIIELRVGDGRMGATSFSMPPAPGVWRPTPPAMAPFFTPWLATTRPLLLTSDGAALDWGAYNADPRTWGAARNPDGTVRAGSGQGGSPGVTGYPAAFRPAGPPAMTSAAYAADFAEVKAAGRADEHPADAGPDRDGAVHLELHRGAVPGGPARPGEAPGVRHQRQRAPLRGGRT